ncbi:FAD-dependent monooxygenase [Catenuloplanes sp. NPDC051500]|uniref:FAD-dependent monooxygenase n=1 Tax=Catenuloplanes sp. NPDC051500 TaxID=3363959 RepID=UPI0037A486D4
MTVLVVGAGPTGLTVACTLLRFGVPCRIVDRRPEGAGEPKALVLWSGALEALRRTGVAAPIVGAALPLAGAGYFSRGKRLGGVRFGGLKGTAFPGPICLPQPATEEALRDRLTALGGKIEWNTALTDLATTPTGVTAVLTNAAGTVETVSTPWLVGADGTRSTVREQLGIDYAGHTYERTFLLADGRLSGPASPDEAEYHLHPDGVLVVVPLPGGGHRVFFDVAPGIATESAPSREVLQHLLDVRGRGDIRIEETWWTSRFRVHAKLAERFREGRVFLAGDAAHCHSPAGGQGLNTGVQDGYDLGWKLATVLRGADESLLDSYEAERRPASARAVRLADRQTRLWMTRGAIPRTLRDTVMRVLFRRGVLERTMVPELAQLDIDHPAGAGASDPAGTTVTAPAAVRLARRMPDAPIADPLGVTGSLHDRLAEGRHTLLAAGGERARDTAALAVRLLAERGVEDAVDVIWLRPEDGHHPGGRPGMTVLGDTGGALASGQTAWLAHVRPDGVVGARAAADEASLRTLLNRLPAARAQVPAA